MTLQEQAENLITDTSILTKLAEFGEVHVVGNVAFATTIKPDIDIQIYCALHYEEASPAIIEVLTGLGLTNIQERRLKKSKKYLILGKYIDHDVVWDIDVTLTQPNTDYLKDSYKFYQDYAPKITEGKRNLIIAFKERFTNEKISGDNAAYYVYLAVLDNDVKNDLEMKKYLDSRKLYK